MLSGEEKEAIDILRSFEPNDLVECIIYLQALEKITNLIDKQQKEIEELNKSDASKEQSSMNYYNLYKELEAKIKAKIEEWQKEKEFYNKDEDREWGQYNNWDWVDTIVNEMQSLLEKE